MKVFIDSSVIVEFQKGENDLFLELLSAKQHNPNVTLCYSGIVLNEYLFYHLAINGGKAPLTLKRDKTIGETLNFQEIEKMFLPLNYLSDHPNFAIWIHHYMSKYNLLPSDAQILFSCVFHKIPYLATFDTTDFALACQTENITIVSSKADLLKYLHQ